MKKLIALIIVLVLGVVSASSFFGVAGNVIGVDLVSPGEGTLDCQSQPVEIEAGRISPEKSSFLCCNWFLANAKLIVTSADPLVKTIAPCCPAIPGWNCHAFNVVYDARDIDPATCPLTKVVVFEVSADVGFGQAVVISNFLVTVIVVPPPPPPPG